jgi:guanine deaminase
MGTGTAMNYLHRAIELSRLALSDNTLTPFGAVLVVDGQIVGEGTSRVIATNDPTAHAEVVALREAGAKLKTHLFATATLYSSGEPCPLCLAACMWARVPRVIFAATSTDIAIHGFEDLLFYREMALPPESRGIQELGATGLENLRAVEVLAEWAKGVPGGVIPKL